MRKVRPGIAVLETKRSIIVSMLELTEMVMTGQPSTGTVRVTSQEHY